jgi:hypothetical protein
LAGALVTIKFWTILIDLVIAVPICPRGGRESDEGVSYCPYCGLALSTSARGKLATYGFVAGVILLGVSAFQFVFAYHIGLWPAGWFWYVMGIYTAAIGVFIILGMNWYRHRKLAEPSEN